MLILQAIWVNSTVRSEMYQHPSLNSGICNFTTLTWNGSAAEVDPETTVCSSFTNIVVLEI